MSSSGWEGSDSDDRDSEGEDDSQHESDSVRSPSPTDLAKVEAMEAAEYNAERAVQNRAVALAHRKHIHQSVLEGVDLKAALPSWNVNDVCDWGRLYGYHLLLSSNSIWTNAKYQRRMERATRLDPYDQDLTHFSDRTSFTSRQHMKLQADIEQLAGWRVVTANGQESDEDERQKSIGKFTIIRYASNASDLLEAIPHIAAWDRSMCAKVKDHAQRGTDIPPAFSLHHSLVKEDTRRRATYAKQLPKGKVTTINVGDTVPHTYVPATAVFTHNFSASFGRFATVSFIPTFRPFGVAEASTIFPLLDPPVVVNFGESLSAEEEKGVEKKEEEIIQKLRTRSNVDKAKHPLHALLLEPVMIPSGLYTFRRRFLERLRRVCDELDILIFADETAAMARLGVLFSYQLYGNFEPDYVITGKCLRLAMMLYVNRNIQKPSSTSSTSSSAQTRPPGAQTRPPTAQTRPPTAPTVQTRPPTAPTTQTCAASSSSSSSTSSSTSRAPTARSSAPTPAALSSDSTASSSSSSARPERAAKQKALAKQAEQQREEKRADRHAFEEALHTLQNRHTASTTAFVLVRARAILRAIRKQELLIQLVEVGQFIEQQLQRMERIVRGVDEKAPTFSRGMGMVFMVHPRVSELLRMKFCVEHRLMPAIDLSKPQAAAALRLSDQVEVLQWTRSMKAVSNCRWCGDSGDLPSHPSIACSRCWKVEYHMKCFKIREAQHTPITIRYTQGSAGEPETFVCLACRSERVQMESGGSMTASSTSSSTSGGGRAGTKRHRSRA